MYKCQFVEVWIEALLGFTKITVSAAVKCHIRKLGYSFVDYERTNSEDIITDCSIGLIVL